MTTIRPMYEDDFDAVRLAHAQAFGAFWRQQRGEGATAPPRTRASVLASWEKDPGGCFVAEDGGRVVGCVFSRTWGSVGWFGALAVLPEYQGQGIGQRLIAASLAYLRQDAQRVVGLETMPESEYNLGLYLRRGFQARTLTFRLSKALEQPGGERQDIQAWSQAGAATQERWLAELREATGRVWPGLDYSKEIKAMAQHEAGETLVLSEGARAIGFSSVRLASVREGEPPLPLARVEALALHPAHTDEECFRGLLEASEGLAHAQGKERLLLPANGGHTWALEHLLAWGYRVEYAMVRMVLEGTDGGPRSDDHVELSAWAG